MTDELQEIAKKYHIRYFLVSFNNMQIYDVKFMKISIGTLTIELNGMYSYFPNNSIFKITDTYKHFKKRFEYEIKQCLKN